MSFLAAVLCVVMIGVSGCANSKRYDSPKRYAGNVYIVGEQYNLYYGEDYELAVTEQGAKNVIHNSEIATIENDTITINRAGRFLFWVKYTGEWVHGNKKFVSQNIIAISREDSSHITVKGKRFKTEVYFPGVVEYGGTLPYGVFNTNTSGRYLNFTTPHLDPFGGTPSISFYTVIDGFKVVIGEAMGYATAIGHYGYKPNHVFHIAIHFDLVISRAIHHEGQWLPENHWLYDRLGFSSTFQQAHHIENQRLRQEYLIALRQELGADWISHPDYNPRWMEFYDAHPVWDERYSTIEAPRGIYHMELSTGQVIQNVLEII